jgi:large subunit ribosomal protein L25
MEQKLTVDRREATGKGAARKIRATGRVPGVVYGHGTEPVPVTVDGRELFHALHTAAGQTVLITLAIDSEQILAMPRQVQRNLLKGHFTHVDFLRIARDEKLTVEVPIHLTGESHGVKEGGVVEHHLWTLEVEAFPQDVPTAIDADITKLGIGDSLRVADLKVADTLTVLADTDETVVSVVQPQILRVEEEEVEAEGEEAAAGEAAEAGEADGTGGAGGAGGGSSEG